MNKLIEIDGNKYEINLDTAIAQGLIKPVTKRHIGQIYKRLKTGNEYILAQTAYGAVSLIDLNDGNRLRNAIEVFDPQNISEQEWSNISCNKDMVLIEKKLTSC